LTKIWPDTWGWYIIKVQTFDPVSVVAFNEYRIMERWFRIFSDKFVTCFSKETTIY